MRMRLIFLVFLVFALTVDAKVIKKSKDTTSKKTPIKKTKLAPAIIAIEIVDPNDNSTKLGKGRKRTIESSLGYGYQSFFESLPKPPRYEVYKYSQQDIPPIKSGYDYSHIGFSKNSNSYNIQKSIQYDLGTKTEYRQQAQPQYQPGTLFTTVDQNGHVNPLSSQQPQVHGGQMVPVIVLRVYTNQLGQPGSLHANIPQNHPYYNLNTVDLQNLVAGYYKNHQKQQNQYQQEAPQQVSNHYHQQPRQRYEYQQSVQAPRGYEHQQAQAQQPQQHYQQEHLQTYENYPDDAHTKVIFRKEQPKRFKITVPKNTFSHVEVQEHVQEYPQMMYYHQQQQQATHQQSAYVPEDKYYKQNDYYDDAYDGRQYQIAPQYYDQQEYYQPDDGQQYQYQSPQHQQVQVQEPVHVPTPVQVQEPVHAPATVQEQEHAVSSQDEDLRQASVESGRDLHPKLYNYHSEQSQSDTAKANKKRKVRKPLVVAPEKLNNQE